VKIDFGERFVEVIDVNTMLSSGVANAAEIQEMQSHSRTAMPRSVDS